MQGWVGVITGTIACLLLAGWSRRYRLPVRHWSLGRWGLLGAAIGGIAAWWVPLAVQVTGWPVVALAGASGGFAALALTDYWVQRLPNAGTLGLLAAAAGTWPWGAQPDRLLTASVVGTVVLGGLTWLQWRLSGRQGVGFGDVKLASALGAWFGPAAVVAVAGGFAVAVIVYVLRAVARRQPWTTVWHQAVPAGTWMIMGLLGAVGWWGMGRGAL